MNLHGPRLQKDKADSKLLLQSIDAQNGFKSALGFRGISRFSSQGAAGRGDRLSSLLSLVADVGKRLALLLGDNFHKQHSQEPLYFCR